MENMNEPIENTGTIKISDEVISTIASVAVSETPGVCGLSGTIAGEIAQRFGKKNPSKGIKVVTTELEVALDISIVVKYGIRIPEIAWEIQENVKKAVESMSGLTVTKVNIHVVGVEFEKEEKNPVAAEETPKEKED